MGSCDHISPDFAARSAPQDVVVSKTCFCLYHVDAYLRQLDGSPASFKELMTELIFEGDCYLSYLARWQKAVERYPVLKEVFAATLRDQLPELKARYERMKYTDGQTRWDNYQVLAQKLPFLKKEISLMDVQGLMVAAEQNESALRL